MRLHIQPKLLERVSGLDLIILEPDATVLDLADALQPFAGCEGRVYKRKLRGPGTCLACADSCCTTSVIAPDPISFEATCRRLGLSASDLLRLHFDQDALAAGVVRLRSYPCTFLAESGACGIYEDRSLICRFFICTPYSPAFEDLVHNILGAGLASLARSLRKRGLLPACGPDGYRAPAPNEAMAAYEVEFDRFYRRWLSDTADPGQEMPPAWRQNPFDSAGNYGEIPLINFTTEAQWRELTRGGIPYCCA